MKYSQRNVAYNSGGWSIHLYRLTTSSSSGWFRDRLTVRQVFEFVMPFKYEKTHSSPDSLCDSILAPKRNDHTKSYLHEG